MAYATLLLATLLVLPRVGLACDPVPDGSPFDGLCASAAGRCMPAPRIAIVSAFPYEQHALRAAVEVTERYDLLGRSVVVGQLGGQRVLLRLTGIGLVNATNITEALIARYDLSAIVFSGVAGSRLRIGEVAVPATWTLAGTDRSFPVDPTLFAAAQQVAADPPTLETCTPDLLHPGRPDVCLAFAPGVFVGGSGSSSDPFGGMATSCVDRPDEVFGCEAHPLGSSEPPVTIEAVDMETAAVAEVAAAHAIPFLGVRGVSDGPGDPQNLPGFPTQFFAYYRISANNAAIVTTRFLAALPPTTKTRKRRHAATLKPAAACGFERITTPECQGASVSRRVEKLVSQACALRAKAFAKRTYSLRLAGRAAARWRRAATSVEQASLPSCCAAGLAQRLRAAADAVTTSPAISLPVPR